MGRRFLRGATLLAKFLPPLLPDNAGMRPEESGKARGCLLRNRGARLSADGRALFARSLRSRSRHGLNELYYKREKAECQPRRHRLLKKVSKTIDRGKKMVYNHSRS